MRFAFLVAAVVGLLILSGCLGSTRPSSAGPDSTGTPPVPDPPAPRLDPAAPLEVPVEGPFALRFVVVAHPSADCSIAFSASGRSTSRVGPSYVTFHAAGEQKSLSGGGFGHIVQAYAGPADPRPIIPGGGGWRVEGTQWIVAHASGEHEFIFAATHLRAGLAGPTGSPASILLRTACGEAGGLDVSGLAAGTEVVLFDEDSMDGGAGAATTHATGAAAAGSKEATVTEAQARFLADADPGLGRLSLEHPGGTGEWTFHPAAPAPLIDHAGPAGGYRVHLDWARPRSADGLTGALLGVTAVDSFDEAFARAAPAP